MGRGMHMDACLSRGTAAAGESLGKNGGAESLGNAGGGESLGNAGGGESRRTGAGGTREGSTKTLSKERVGGTTWHEGPVEETTGMEAAWALVCW